MVVRIRFPPCLVLVCVLHPRLTDLPSSSSYMLIVGVVFIVVDSIGGELMWAGGVSFVSDIPKKEHWPLKTHLFLNAGRLDRLDLSESISSLFSL